MAEDVLAPLSGTIWKITVAVDDAVEEDDEVLILEALKMETPIYAPCGGKVKEIHVKKAMPWKKIKP